MSGKRATNRDRVAARRGKVLDRSVVFSVRSVSQRSEAVHTFIAWLVGVGGALSLAVLVAMLACVPRLPCSYAKH